MSPEESDSRLRLAIGGEMTRIGEMFGQARKEGRGVFVPYVTLGDPDLETTRRVVLELEAAGADLIELGVPFSDPLADGPVIQRATERALSQGFTLEKGLTWVAGLRRQTQVPLVLFSYYNPLFAYGFERLAAAAKQRGIDGFLITDLSVEEAEAPLQVLRKAGLDSVFLAAPTSTDERIRKIAAYSSGFIYAVSRTGVTGARKSLSDEVQSLIRKIRSHSSLPIAVGFGVSEPAHLRQIWSQAEGAVVGSAIVGCIERNLGQPDLAERVGAFARWLKGGS